MATTVTVPVSGIDDIECFGGAVLTPASVSIRYDRRHQPYIKVSGPTRWAADGETTEHTWVFGGCTCHKWLADLVEHHRPKGHRCWDHAEWSAWEIAVGRWINIDDAPDPHRDVTAAFKAALDDVGECEVARYVLANALTTERNR